MLFIGLIAFTAIWVLSSRFLFKRSVTVKECVTQFAVTTMVILLVLVIGDWQSTADNELFHGEVVSKERKQDYFQTSYKCNCSCTSRDKQGNCTNESCDTCYTDHYTVDWSLKTTLGPYRVDYIDRESKSAWSTPDPTEYLSAYTGQPFSKSRHYTNYFMLYKDSLFASNPKLQTYSKQLENSTYPCVTGYYVNLVYNTGVRGIDTMKYNDLVRDYLKVAGSAKQANVILYFTPILDQSFRYALEAKWVGGKKNDVIIIIGVDPAADLAKPLKAAWVDTISMGKNIGNEMLQVVLREDLINADLSNPTATTEIIFKDINKHFHRKPMSSFKYIEESRQTPSGVILAAILLTLMLNIGFTILNVRYFDIE